MIISFMTRDTPDFHFLISVSITSRQRFLSKQFFQISFLKMVFYQYMPFVLPMYG